MKTVKQCNTPQSSKCKTVNDATATTYRWDDLAAKKRIFLQIMREILDDPDLGEQYLKSDSDAAQAFKDKGMDVPDDVKVVFLPVGDGKKLPLGAGSAIIELPSQGQTGNPLTEKQLLDLFDCTYHLVW
jgi:hypothetical protein